MARLSKELPVIVYEMFKVLVVSYCTIKVCRLFLFCTPDGRGVCPEILLQRAMSQLPSCIMSLIKVDDVRSQVFFDGQVVSSYLRLSMLVTSSCTSMSR